jgi:hypothetical protein
MTITSLTGPPLIQPFSANGSQAVESEFMEMSDYFKLSIPSVGCFNPTTDIEGYTYGTKVYALAHKAHPESPLLPEALSDAAQILFTSLYAVIVSTSLFQPISPATNSTGIKTTSVSRLVVVVPIAYTITLILFGVVLAIATMFWHGKKPNVLEEEPTGLLSSALLLHSINVTQLVEEAHAAPENHGSMMERLKRRRLKPDTMLMVESYSPLRVSVQYLETESH